MLALLVLSALTSASGTTHAPQAGARLHHTATLAVWEPTSRPSRVVIYVHGYYDRLDAVLSEHRLVEQLAASGLDATVLVPEAPVSGREAVVWPDLDALLDAAEAMLGRPLDRRAITAVGHSGAIRTLRAWLPEPALHTVVLLDAMYGDARPLAAWLARGEHHRLHLVSRSTAAQATAFVRALPAHTQPRVVHERTRTSHMGIVTEGVYLPRILASL